VTTETTQSTLTRQQYKNYGPAPAAGYGEGAAIWAHVRFDDQCGNGHNTFSITGTVRVPRQREAAAGGCLHDDIARAFPHLAPFIKWHLCSTDGPMHYPGNAVYLAGVRDCWGRAAGEPSAWETVVYPAGLPLGWRSRCDGFLSWLKDHPGVPLVVVRVEHGGSAKDRDLYGPKWTLDGAPTAWHMCPFDTEAEALEFVAAAAGGFEVRKVPTAFSRGKARELDAARRAAVWPDATDEDLTAPGLEERLAARLPALLAEFRAAVEGLGFTW
jgi:hypothetical protein